jgi:hypothetical protein
MQSSGTNLQMASTKEIELFPTTIYRGFFHESFDVDSVVSKLKNECRDIGTVENLIYEGHQIFDLDIPEFDAFKKYICDFFSTNDKKYTVKRSWLNISSKCDNHNIHSHYEEGVDWNVVWYLQVNSDTGRIFFHNESLNKYMDNGPESEYEITPHDWMWIGMPSWLSHSTEKNYSEQERICCAFDLARV